MLNTRNIFKEVVAQLHLAIVSWTNQPTAKLIVGKFEEMIKGIYLFLQKAPKDTVVHLLQSQYLTDWIWHGSGFASPEKIALESRFPKSINVYPYLFRLPNELFKVKDFLLSHGVKQQFDVDDLLDMLFRIKEKHDNGEQPPEEVNQDLDRCRAVLEWIIRSEAQISEERRCKLLIPVQCQPGKLQLEPCNNCTYCDREFLRRGVSEHQISFQSHLIHKAISEDLASHLQVPRLSSCLAGARSIGIKFKEAGQYEPLTTRLRNILQQYKEGVAIFKEVIQNADDARASKVCFVVDWRENPRERLLTEELAECQGPALWAYNDAKFTDKDFENINKLAGETKKEDLDKVGRFGLGFNSVYHLTDVPSFLSGEHIVFFDPNMTHISNLLEAKMRQGGVMLSLKENKDVRSAFPDQFLPYDQLFGCDMTETGTFDFKGTLFRFPFRTQKSEISNEPYTPDNVKNLMKLLKESASTLLLFAQNVKEVQVYEIQKNSTPKKSLVRPIIRVTKSIEKTLYTNVTEGSILRNSSNWLSRCQASGGHAQTEGPRCTELLKMNLSMAKSDLSGMSEALQREDMWLVNYCTGERSSLQVAQSVDGKRNAVVPVTGVAVKMTQSDAHGTKIVPITGEVFCFMPLSIKSGFPVHVNGSFSVYQNRRRLWEECVGEHHSLKPFEAKWNEALMKDSLVQSYLQLLEILTSFNDKNYEFHSLWPNPTKVSHAKAWKPFLMSFFSHIIDEEWPLFYCNGKWTRLQDCLILDPKLNNVAECVTIMNLLGEKVLSIPQEFLEAFKSCGKKAFIKKHMLTEDRFLREFFFPNAPRIPIRHRNSVLVHILDRRLKKHQIYDELLRIYPCFSCSKDGTLLRTPKELIHPKGKAAPLFCEEEKRFPLGERFLTKERAMMLEELGMVIDFLPWRVLCERAQWVSNHGDKTKAALLIQFMNKTPPQCKISEEQSETLKAAKFLPILSKPKDYPFSWKSDQCRTTHLAAANQLYPERHKNLVGSSQLILDESSNTSNVPNHSLKKILGFTTKQPLLSDVITQLDLVIQFGNSRESICLEIYEFFQKVSTSERYRLERVYLREQLECRPWLLVKDQMVYAKFVARNWRKEDGSPYLFGLPLLYIANFNDLLNWYGIKESFDQNDVIVAISKLRNDIGRRKISDNQIRTLIVLLEEVFSVESDPTAITDSLPLPSTDDLLYDADELVINETPWLEADGRQKPVHEKIPTMLAYKCGAKRLRDADLTQCSEPIGIKFKEGGQYEPLTTRLRNILQQYKEGVAIFKEIIQNADDAGASKVCFVVDWRENPRERLLTEELAECQGPALWAYNDAMFTDRDFENINKLAGEIKKDDLDKVGRFGLGFNSVYHLTDVPSIVSGEHMVILDPNMSHISELVDGKMRRSGVMLSLVENKNNLSAFPDQFSPYNNLFGFDMTGSSDFHFKGTLFRLPFRTAKQAQESKVSKEPYSRDKLNILMKSLKESAATVLLFTQNVQEVQVFEIAKSSKPETSLKRPLIRIGKSVEKVLHTNDADRSGAGTILQNSSAWLLKSRESKMVCESEVPRRTELLKIDISMAKSELYEVSKVVQEEDRWIVNSCAGSKSSLQVAQSDEGVTNAVVPIAGVAVKITQSKKHGTKIIPVTGEVFCFMPLSIESGFPMHVNGSFSLYPSRRRLWEEGVGENDSLIPFEAKWNEALMEDALVQSYLQLLEILTSFKDKKYEFHSLWPNPTMVNYPKAWKPFLISFFNQIIDEEWPLFYCNKKWRTLHDCLILDPKLNKIDVCVTIMKQLGKNVLSLPQNFIEAFNSSGKGDFIESHMLTEDKFLREFFFPKVSKMPNQLRDSVLIYILDRRLSKHREYDDLLLSYPSFSCSRDGQFLRKPNDLVHPNGRAACLFAAEEMRFPVDERLLERERALMLEELGMVVDFLPWSALCQRAKWVSNRCDVQKAGLLIEYMNNMPKEYEISDEETKIIRAAQFLPILPKPKDYPFAWKSHTTQLAAADQLFPERHKYVVGSFQLILKESPGGSNVPNESLQNILGLSSKQPELSDVFAQFDQVIKSSHLLTKEMKETVCLNIYDFLQKILSSKKFASQMPYLHEQLKCRPWMVVRGHMVDPKLVARNWNKEDGSPYLFALPEAYKTKFKELIDWYGVKETFCEDDFIEAITKLREDVGDKKLKESRFRTLIVLLEHLFKLRDTKPEISLPLPSVDGHLYDADKLVINQTPWLETDESSKFVHDIVPRILAYKCGAKDADLTRYSEPIGQPFGQHEKLTDRLRNILKAYPADVGILKELLQNADDAGAEEIHFVYDPRTHGSKYIFSDKWKDLQGPAICVYNDKPFSKEDIEGIGRFGIGSKVDDPLKTGQHGIGLNAVYHLTDCPYFISNDEVIYVSDPHIAYVPGATERKPERLFKQLDKRFRRYYQGVFSGFLGDLFKLEGSTMFRFPLRRSGNYQSKISTKCWNEKKVTELFDEFRLYAKDMLLFLNHVNKTSVSQIKNGKLETYSVTCEVSDQDKCAEFFEKMKACSGVPTATIPWQEINYVIKISDTNKARKDWLVIQSLGHVDKEGSLEVPDGTSMGLLPRAGIAISLPSTETNTLFRHSVFCVLPLPISTKFPAHINGHFALDSSRRKLWDDPNCSDARVLWNNFMKRHVIAPAYAGAICHARKHIVGLQAESDNSGVFLSEEATENGLRWYHQLFPSIADLDSEWKPVGQELYKNFLSMLPVLPVATSVPRWKKPATENTSEAKTERTEQDEVPVTVTWCTVSNSYFCTSEMTWLLEKTLLNIGFLLLSHTPSKVRESFKTVKQCHDVCPVQVRNFLLNCEIQDGLPTAVENTVLRHVHNIYELTKYCAKAEDFFQSLEGVPLLLQQDDVLAEIQCQQVNYTRKISDINKARNDSLVTQSLGHVDKEGNLNVTIFQCHCCIATAFTKGFLKFLVTQVLLRITMIFFVLLKTFSQNFNRKFGRNIFLQFSHFSPLYEAILILTRRLLGR